MFRPGITIAMASAPPARRAATEAVGRSRPALAPFLGGASPALQTASAGTAEPSRAFFVSDIKVKATQASQELLQGGDGGVPLLLSLQLHPQPGQVP